MSEEVSRRRLFGWLAAAAIAVTAPALVASVPAEAQTVGMERRQSRRQGRPTRYAAAAREIGLLKTATAATLSMVTAATAAGYSSPVFGSITWLPPRASADRAHMVGGCTQ